MVDEALSSVPRRVPRRLEVPDRVLRQLELQRNLSPASTPGAGAGPFAASLSSPHGLHGTAYASSPATPFPSLPSPSGSASLPRDASVRQKLRASPLAQHPLLLESSGRARLAASQSSMSLFSDDFWQLLGRGRAHSGKGLALPWLPHEGPGGAAPPAPSCSCSCKAKQQHQQQHQQEQLKQKQQQQQNQNLSGGRGKPSGRNMCAEGLGQSPWARQESWDAFSGSMLPPSANAFPGVAMPRSQSKPGNRRRRALASAGQCCLMTTFLLGGAGTFAGVALLFLPGVLVASAGEGTGLRIISTLMLSGVLGLAFTALLTFAFASGVWLCIRSPGKGSNKTTMSSALATSWLSHLGFRNGLMIMWKSWRGGGIELIAKRTPEYEVRERGHTIGF